MSSSALTVSEENIKRVENYLKGYMINRKLLMMKNYETKYFDTCEWESETPVEFAVVRAKMYQTRHFVLNIKNSNEKLLLYYHFIRGESVERCAELLGISRSSAFRLKKKALCVAYMSSISAENKVDIDIF